MCGRYALHAHPDVVALQFNLSAIPAFEARYNIAPAADALVVRAQRAAVARWGLRGKFVNLRAETVQTKFKTSGRCLVPASGFYEWQSTAGRKQPYYFFPADGSLLALGAIWERDTFSLITTEPNATLRGIHDRMPVIIAPEDYTAWFAGEDGLLRPAPDAALKAHPVSLAVNTAAHDSPRLIEPVELARGLFD
jgi:putative SOS response-associated peptidase YedK